MSEAARACNKELGEKSNQLKDQQDLVIRLDVCLSHHLSYSIVEQRIKLKQRESQMHSTAKGPFISMTQGLAMPCAAASSPHGARNEL